MISLSLRKISFAFLYILLIGLGSSNASWAQCPPSGAVGITTCCANHWSDAPCGVPINKPYLRAFNPPTISIIPDSGNPNNVTIGVNNGSFSCETNGACSGAYCGSGPKYIKTPFYYPSTSTITPAITRNYPISAYIGGNPNYIDLTKLPANQCTIVATWSGGCGMGSHSDTYAMGPCVLPTQPKPTPKPKLNECKAGLSPSETTCQPGLPDPVDPYSGDYYYAEEDLAVPGIIPLRVVRSYTSSLSAFTGPFGVGTYLAGYNYAINVPLNPDGTVNTSPSQTVLLDEGNGITVAFSNGSGGGLVFTNNDVLGTTGDTLTLSVNGSNVLISAVYQTTEKNQFYFDGNGRLTQTQDDSGNTVTFTRDAQGKLLTATSLGRSLTFTYNSANLIQDVTDHTGRKVLYNYDSSNRLYNVIDPEELVMSYTWDGQNRVQSVMDKRNNASVLNTYQANGMVNQQTLFVGNTSAAGVNYRLEATAPLTRRLIDPNGNTRQYTYNSQGLLIEERDGLNHVTTITYSPSLFNGSASNRYIERTDALNHTTRTDLNTRNLPTTITDADGKTTTITYDSVWLSKPHTITDALNHTTTFTYDTSGNLIEIEDPDTNLTTMTYNSRGQVLTVTNALNKVTSYGYNSAGDLTSMTNPLNHVTGFGYNSLGLMTSVTDPKNQTTTLDYDLNNQVTDITNPLSQATELTYDGNGNITAVKNARNNTTSYLYDRKNRLLRVTQPGNLQTNYIYDDADRLTRITDAKSQQRNFSYDAANRLTQEEVKAGSTVQALYTYTYDDTNRLITIGDGTNAWSLSYDVVDRLTQLVSPQGTVGYTYDAVGRRMQMTATGQSAVTYGYDVLDRLTSLTQGTQTYGYGYDDIGRRTSLTRPNGVTTSYAYDDANRLTQLRHLKTGVLDEQHDYTFDNNGNILTTLRDGSQRTYTYDALDRVTRMVKSPVPGEPLPKQIDWTYDANGNITQRQETDDSNVVTTYGFTYNTRDWLTQRTVNGGSAATLTYDNNGNLTGDVGRSLTWNAQNQLTGVTVGGVTTSFTYDPLGRRTGLTQGITSKTYLYDDLDMLGDGSNTYLHGAGIDEPLQVNTDSSLFNYLSDHLGSVTKLSDNTGSSVAQYFYGPYGKQLSSSTPLAGNPFTYTGREDDSTGLLHYRARYYDPNLEVFISQDPLGDAQRYVDGNPVLLTDPLGLDALSDTNDFIAGYADLATGGLTSSLRGNNETYLGRIVNPSSSAYLYGQGLGVAELIYAPQIGAVSYGAGRVCLIGKSLPTSSGAIAFKNNHYAPRLIRNGINVPKAEAYVIKQIRKGNLTGRFKQDKSLIEYRGHIKPDGTINIGTIFRVNSK